MIPSFSMLGIVVQDMEASLTFYQRLGLPIPAHTKQVAHVEVVVTEGFTLFWDTFTFDHARRSPQGGYRLLLEFTVAHPAEVDTIYADLVSVGYHSYQAPNDAPFGARVAMIDDPDGNTVMISAPV